MKTYVVIGLGRFGTAVAAELCKLGHEVLAIDGDEAKMIELKRFMERLGIPSTLKDMGVEVKREHLEAVLKETVAGPDMEHIPYEITEDMVFEAMQKVERI